MKLEQTCDRHVDCRITLAKIEKTSLGYEDHGILTAWIYLDYDGVGQGAGGYYFAGSKPTIEGLAFGMLWVKDFIDTVGVDSWENLVGKQVYAHASYSKVYGIERGPFVKHWDKDRSTSMFFDDLKYKLEELQHDEQLATS
jgi:hypothetical protein